MVHLYQWGDGIDVRGDGRAKRLGTPAIEGSSKFSKIPESLSGKIRGPPPPPPPPREKVLFLWGVSNKNKK